MGAGWYVATERELPGRSGQLPHGGRALLFAQHHLEEIARLADVPPIKDFFSSDPTSIAAYLRSQGVEKDPDELPEEEWYSKSIAENGSPCSPRRTWSARWVPFIGACS